MKAPRIVLVASLALTLAMIAFASTQPELGKWWKNSDVVRKLELTQSQIDRIEQSFLHFRPMLASLTDELKKHESELRILMTAEPMDDAKVLTQSERVAQSRSALEKANSSMMLAIRKELSKDQWNRLQDIRESRKSSSGLRTARPGAPGVPSPQTVGKIYTTQDPIVPPKVLYSPLPAYTQEARHARIEGIILMQVVIRKDGQVANVRVLQGLGYGLDESAIETISRDWRFAPGTLEGGPVDVQANIEVSFRFY